jgi:hypothetical protein
MQRSRQRLGSTWQGPSTLCQGLPPPPPPQQQQQQLVAVVVVDGPLSEKLVCG